MRSTSHELSRERQSSAIAVIGMSGRFAASPNLEAFWSHLQAGESCIEEIKRKGWETGTHSDSERVNTTQFKWGGMLQDIDRFDPLFFNISPREATNMDPQQRLFLEEAYKAFEDAGYSAEQLAEKKVGVFVGARASDYKDLRRECRDVDGGKPRPCGPHPRRMSVQEDQMDAHLFLGNDMAVLAARISYFFNFKGPSLTIDTASSSSLVAIHLACESLHTGEAEMALAGGVFVMSSPAYAVMAAKAQILSPDGKCKTFDKNANGIVLGEGVGAIVLKPLDAAIEDRDHIYGIILGSALNQDGKTFGMTTPSLLSQKALISDLYRKVAIDPETISYLEAHGTGSKLGDPIEVQALKEAFRSFTDKIQFCAIGSHKPNFGHTITSAGIAGVFKVLLAMKYQQIPPTINIEEVNPQIDFEGSPFFVNTELKEWKSRDRRDRACPCPRRAGVSSFGLSGTNCHIILEEPPPQKKIADNPAMPYYFFPLSAKTSASLSQKVEDMVKWLEKEGANYSVEDISYTLVLGRSHFAVRSAVVARDNHELQQHLRELLSEGQSEHSVENAEGHRSEQTEPLLQKYGNWLLQELRENNVNNEKDYKEKITSLADIYVKGYQLDWGQLFEKERYHRVPLPTYPFFGESYWIADPSGQDRRGSALGLSAQAPNELHHRGTTLDLSREDKSRLGIGQEQALAGQTRPQRLAIVSTDKLHKALLHTVSHLLNVRVEEIDVETPLSEYGFDSITFTEFANHLNQTYQLDLTPPLFFEYSTIKNLAQYLYTTYASTFATCFDGVPARGVAAGTGARKPSQPLQMGFIPVTPAAPIAIIGMSGSFPQAPDVQNLWSNLLASRDCISEIPPSRWDWQTHFGDPATSDPNKTNVKWAGIVGDVEMFDPLFFSISLREAEQMDPQQRLLMIYVWKAIEDAGYSASAFSGTNTALFVGTGNSGYNERLSRAGMAIESYSSTGQAPSVGPNRMSYFLDLHGPSEAIDTACSSSLVAIHRGVNAIESGQCIMAIVGGVNTLVSPELHISYSKAGMLSSDGRCKPFSAQANGYVRGEGVGMLVLKSLSDAEQAGDHIYGVIRGSAENHGGKASSLTAPNPRAQADVLIAAYRKAGIDPRTVGYIEAHGTGTALGDPIEINGLKTAFSELAQIIGEGPMPQVSCGIGSVKSNIGHLELASGVTGVIKVLLQMQHKKLVKSLHCEQINPYIQLEESPFYIVQENREWEAPQDHAGNLLPRRAGVSSFGFGGANAHVVLEEYVPEPQEKLLGSLTQSREPDRGKPYPPLLIVLSAKNEERLNAQVRQLLAWVVVGTAPCACPTSTEEPQDQQRDRSEAQFLQDLAYTLQVGREAMEERLALLVSSRAQLEESLRSYLQEPQGTGDWYRGQAKQYKAMQALLGAGEELQEISGKWLQHGKYEKLLQGWVKGFTIDWELLYGEQRPRRISLPTYPFARERYWLPTTPIGTRTGASGQGQAAVPTSPYVGAEPRTFLQKASGAAITVSLRPLANHSAHSGNGVNQSQLEEELVRSLAQCLYMEEGAIDVEKPFVEMGLDSVVGVEWIQSLNKQYACNLKASSVYDYPTIRQLASFLQKDVLKHQHTHVQGTGDCKGRWGPAPSGEGASPSSTPRDFESSGMSTGRSVDDCFTLSPDRSQPYPPLQSPIPTALKHREAIAIVGMSGKYPDAHNLTDFWDNLVQGKSAIREIPLSRFNVSDYYDPNPTALRKMYCKWLGALDEIEYFDPFFFHLSPAEAEVMDPQHRLFLEEGYKAFEDAGYNPQLLSNKKCGVYLGIMSHEYDLLLYQHNAAEMNLLGSSSAIAAARIAYLLNLKGPALAIDTACSSSLVAMHLACQALRNREIDMALVGGVSLYLTLGSYVSMCSAGMLSPSGQCNAFDASADGFVPGEGVGAVVLKRLGDAEVDHDQISGVIIGSGMNQDGATNGITAPSVKSQIELVREIYEKYQIDPETIHYVEMHGTGTKLGDPIELEALGTVFCEKTQRKQYCAIGSVKSNIGHTSAAAGMAGLHKVLLAIKQQKLVPSLHFERPNPHFDFAASPFYVNTEVQDWKSEKSIPRRAAVSSFGFSGTNAHIVIEEYITAHRDKRALRTGAVGTGLAPVPTVFVLSAKSKLQLKRYAQEMKHWIQVHLELILEDIAFTLQLGRAAMNYRLAILADSREVLLQKLEQYVYDQASLGVYAAQVKRSLELGESPDPTNPPDNDGTLFETDQGGQPLPHIWYEKKDLEKIAQVWVKGVDVDWNLLYGEKVPHRVSLPTYPFARERYWIPTETFGTRTETVGTGASPVPTVSVRNSCPLATSDLHDLSAHQLPTRSAERRTMLLTPVWKEEAIPRLHLSQESPLFAKPLAPSNSLAPVAMPLVLLCELPVASNPPGLGTLAPRIQARLGEGGRCRSLSSMQTRRGLRFQDMVVQLIQEFQHLWDMPTGYSRPTGPILVQVVVMHSEEPSLLEALAGVLKTVQQEYPQLRGQLIEVEGEQDEEELLACLQENQYRPHEPRIRYRDGKRWIIQWQEVGGGKPRPYERKVPWKEGGCYLISGGAGGLAQLFVQEIARQVQEATIILVGRSALSVSQHAQIVASRLAPQTEGSNIHIDYQQVDVSDGPAVYALIQRVLAQYGHLDGIIHAAGVLKDNLVLNKTQEEVQAVLAPKVIGVEHLDEASSEIPLDFFILFSSLSAVVGNKGHADYAGANAYLDAIAHARRAMVLAGKRQGTTLSINWPLWEAGGMQLEASTIQVMRELLGVEVMRTETGIKTLYQALACGQAQVMVLHGQVERIKQRLLHKPELPVVTGPVAAASLQESTETLREALKQIVSHLLKVRIEEIDAETELSEYGFDSITFTKFTDRLNQTYQLDLTPALFYEYSTIESLVRYLHTTYAPVFASHFAAVVPPVAIPQVAPELMTADNVSSVDVFSRRHKLTGREASPGPDLPRSGVAIVGMSGMFPQAPDVQSLWSNLLAGQDCIGGIPQERWDWQTYFGRSASEANTPDLKWAGIVEGVKMFDPLFFGISPREAEQMDPQQRLLMIYVWKAIEDAGYSAESLSGTKTALFIGTASSRYSDLLSRAGVAIEGYSSTSQVPSVGPNRMSYFLNLHGPSEPIETACSSSLVAIHRGVKAIESGECCMVIVGGINTLVSPEIHLSLSKAGVLSPDGRCKPFSAQANGYVRSEGVGMLVLKSLSDAEQAGDHIYGVIRGSAENHGGHASSLTAPNPRAQADVLIEAYRKAGLDPRTVSYIEAHGTGTKLGDPIEVNGLKTAFSELAEITGEGPVSQAWCGIGSIKRNIGHLEIAAGVAGVIKVLLQLQHKKLVKSLHCEQLNPYIQLDASPFYIVQENREWEALQDRDGNALPRRAGVSSFGFGGVNAHVVLEEYVPKPRSTSPGSFAQLPGWPLLIVLSARNEERLQEQVRQLLASVQAGTYTEDELPALAYTLQVGRSSMEERLALQVSSLADLVEKLHRYLHEPQGRGDWYRGQVRRDSGFGVFAADEDGQRAIAAWMSKGKYGKLLELWVKGLTIDWKLLYTVGAGLAPALPNRISLPTYPFAQECYWIPSGAGPKAMQGTIPTASPTAATASSFASLHPLVQLNISDFSAQRFSSTFHGKEFFLADHVVQRQHIMPGVVYLEMVHAAIAQTMRNMVQQGEHILYFRHVVWARPLIVGEHPFTVHITLELQEDGTIAFVINREELEAETTGAGQAASLHCQGTAEVHADSSIQSLNLSATQARCQDRTLMATECYQLFRELSINYGPTLQGIEQLNIGQDEVLARLRLPAALGAQTYGEEGHMEAEGGRRDGACPRPLPYMLHPSMLDAALQACIGLLIEQPEIQEPEVRSLRTVVPFMLEELSVVAEVPTEGWAWVRRASGSTTGSLFDIDVCNNEGLIVVRLRGLSIRILPSTDLLPAEPNVPARKALPVARADSTDEALREKSIAYLKEQIGKMLNIPRTKINVAEPLTSYGLDSILVLQLAQTLRTAGLEQISTTLFFEHATIDALVEHFLSTQKEVLRCLVGSDQSVHLAVPSSGPRKDLDSQRLRLGKAYPPKPHKSSGNAIERDIAIIGLAGRYPEAKDVQAFWELLKAGKSGIREIPPSRWDWRGYFQAEKGATGSICTRWGGFLENIECFDASFFRISPREAEQMDPQERLFLEVSSACIEDAGYTPAGLGEHGSVGVFVGAMNGNYPTGARYWSIANRVSFTLGLQGPSLAVDTACSSSLTALHLAVESLVSGTSACAIVGGVNLIVDPVHWVRLSEMGMLSVSDQCSSFGVEADGFVDAEGVGAILIKPLKWAEADGDHIYAVIKATATNHGGKTNGYTVPNPQAQAEVIEEALERAGVDARTISYVEAHGSGTTLGDPIEIAGLMRAFENSGVRNKQYCAIGSVKSNIGHTESAAGIAGITKVVLQMLYEQLVPSLHAEVPNPQIDFRVTPFVVQQELSEWKREKGAGEGKEIPRRAGVSSFGAGGSNAHVILEEYRGSHRTGVRHSPHSPNGQACPDGELNSSSLRPALIVLSARTEERLNEQVKQLLAWLQTQEYAREVVEQGQDGNEGRSQSLLDNLAYTLQVGREAMQERLALLVNSLSELEEKLRKYIEGQDEEGDWYQGQVKPNDVLDLFTTGEESQKMVAAWVSNGKYGKLLAWWVKGGPVDWKQFYTLGAGSSRGPIPTAPALPQRISLPTYPFARERYWIPSTPVGTRTGAVRHTMLHPLAPVTSLLVQHNISDFFGQRFSSTFSGEEFFLADHVVKGQRIMPGVVYLEMARVAVAQAMRTSGTSTGTTEGERILHLTNVVWVRPLAIGKQPVEVHIALELRKNQEVVFTISSHTREARDEVLIHSQGRAAWHAREGIVPNVDLTIVQQRCQSQISAIECYQRYHELFIDYGPSLQGVEQIVVGDGEALARLRLPVPSIPVAPGVAQTQWGKPTGDGFVLHPSMLDAALQTCIALLYDLQELYLPFALEELSIAGEVPVQGWAWVRRRSGSMAGPMFDIEVCDDEGRVAVRLRGLSMRMPPPTDVQPDRRDIPGINALAQSMPLVGTLKLSPLWDQIVLSQQPSEGNTANRVIIVGGTPDEQRAIAGVYPSVHILEITTDTSVEKLAQQLRVSVLQALHVFWLAPHDPQPELSQESILVAQQQGVLLCFRLIKALLQLGYESQTLHWTVLTRQARMWHATEIVNPTHAGLLGLFGSLAKEVSHWSIQQVDLPSGVPLPLAEMQRLPADPQGHGWLYRNGHWYHQILVPLDVSSFATREAYRRGGVYAVIGGAGGIGEVWSEYLIRKYQAHIIWIGRRKSDARIQAKQKRLATLGPKPHYITADATERQALQQAYQEIKRNFGQIHGVVHSAIVLEDQSLAKMDEERFKVALSAKVDVSVRLAQVFEQEPLDFVLFFSSLNAFARNAGQSSYAAGSTFEDAFASQLGQDWPCVVKVMNWGYWGSVGVVAKPVYRERMVQAGVGSIEPTEAMEALEQLLVGPVDQMVLLKTTKTTAPMRSVAQDTQVRRGPDRGQPHLTLSAIPVGEMIQANEMRTVYPERLHSYIHSLHNYRPPLLKHTTTSVATSVPVTPEVDASRLEGAMHEALKQEEGR